MQMCKKYKDSAGIIEGGVNSLVNFFHLKTVGEEACKKSA